MPLIHVVMLQVLFKVVVMLQVMHHASKMKPKDVYQISNATRIGIGTSNQKNMKHHQSASPPPPKKKSNQFMSFKKKRLPWIFRCLQETSTLYFPYLSLLSPRNLVVSESSWGAIAKPSQEWLRTWGHSEDVWCCFVAWEKMALKSY